MDLIFEKKQIASRLSHVEDGVLEKDSHNVHQSETS
jgi:hypothetical protein